MNGHEKNFIQFIIIWTLRSTQKNSGTTDNAFQSLQCVKQVFVKQSPPRLIELHRLHFEEFVLSKRTISIAPEPLKTLNFSPQPDWLVPESDIGKVHKGQAGEPRKPAAIMFTDMAGYTALGQR